MPLRGRVTDYGLADILQLVSQGGRSGRLRVEQGMELIDIYLSHGTVVDVRTSEAGSDGALGIRLVRAGLLTDSALGQVLALRAESGALIGDLLTRGGHVEDRDVRHHATLLRWDALMSPFTWSTGQYALEESEITVQESWAEPIPVDHVLLKGLRLVEEWPNARKQIPSMGWVVARRLPLPAASENIDPFDAIAPEPEGSVTEEARAIHNLAAPGAGIAYIIGCSPFDRYETTLALAELAEKGFIVVTPP